VILEQSARIDWLTAIAETDFQTAVFSHVFAEIMDMGRDQAATLKPGGIGPYHGSRILGCTWGMRSENDNALLALAGTHAYYYFDEVMRPLPRVTRIDLAVTVLLSEPQHLADKAYQRLGGDGENGRYKCARSIIHSSDGGATLYLGTRTGGGYYGRLYDKGVQSKSNEPGLLWRYEVETKGREANRLAHAAYHDSWGGREIDAWVEAWWRERGVSPLIHTSTDTPVLPSYKEDPTDEATRKLAWLATTARPVVSALKIAGFSMDVYNILGLTAPNDPHYDHEWSESEFE
jgi:hypothetical protein